MKIQLVASSIIPIFICFLFLFHSCYSIPAAHTLFFDNRTDGSNIIPFSKSYLPDLFTQVNETTLYQYINDIQGYGPHPTGSDALSEVGDYIYSLFQSFGIQTTYDPWEVDGVTGKNIIATIPGETQSRFIVTAHYDTIEVSPGADDDGSGIASILMIAEILKSFQFHNTITFTIFSGEEIGCLGSTSYAQNAVETDQDIIGVLSLDKIGYAKTTDDGNTVRRHADPQSRWMIDISQDIIKKYHSSIGLTVNGLSFDPSSDHRSFVNLGFSGSNLVEEALNPMYHTSEDTIDYINVTYLSKVTKLALALTTRTASLHPSSNDHDLEIQIKGSYLSNPSCLSVTVQNKQSSDDSVNVSITVQMRHLFRDQYVHIIKEFYTEPCFWNFTKMINDSWTFDLGPRVFTQGFFQIAVTVSGRGDDFSIYVEQHTIGIIY
jgi:hypothetical protein